MAFIWILFFSITLFIQIVVKKSKLYSPIVFTNILWIVVFIGAKIRLYNLYETDEVVFNIIGFGILSYNIFYLVSEKYVFTVGYKPKFVNTYDFRYGLFRVISLVLLFVYLFFAIESIKVYSLGYALADIRSYYYGNLDVAISSETTQYYMQIVKTYFLEPFTITYIAISSLIAKTKKQFLYLAVLVALNIFITGGRYIMLYALICIWISIIYRNLEVNKKIIGKVVIAVISFLVIISIVSRIRNSSTDVFKTMYTYLIGDMPFLSILITKTNGMQCGPLVLINGLIQPIFFVLKFFHIIPDYPEYFYEMNKILMQVNNGVMIAPDVEYNAFATFSFLPYTAMGVFGVFLSSAILGCFEGTIYRRIKYNMELRDYAILTVVLIIQFKCIQLAPLSNVSLILSLVYVLLFFRRRQE